MIILNSDHEAAFETVAYLQYIIQIKLQSSSDGVNPAASGAVVIGQPSPPSSDVTRGEVISIRDPHANLTSLGNKYRGRQAEVIFWPKEQILFATLHWP